jgi:NTP pyrophosphatase (non-canonical NTP hydrolase)
MKESVEWFGKKMFDKLKRNTTKEHWLKTSYEYLFIRMEEEMQELKELLSDDKIPYKHKKMILECADIGNFAMMIADKAKKGAIY